MESLQIAQILADLSDLQNTEPAAATSLLTVHRRTQSTPPEQPPRFDRLGRRVVGPVRSTPPLSRSNSSFSNIPTSPSTLEKRRSVSGRSSGAATPIIERDEKNVLGQADEDLKRARTLLELFEMRGKFKQMGDSGLLKSKERVDAVAARYAKRDLEERERGHRARYLSPKA